MVEFIFAWLQPRPAPHPFRTSADDARAGSELEDLMKRVEDRSNPHSLGITRLTFPGGPALISGGTLEHREARNAQTPMSG